MKNVLTFGEIMMRLSPPGHRRFSQASSFEVEYGGAESNVAVSLSHFGIKTEFVSRIPANDLGDAALMELQRHQVGVEQVVRGGERLGIYFLESGAVHRRGKVVYDRAYSGMASLDKGMIDWNAALESAGWFHWSGITPALSAGAARACLEALQTASRLGIPISMDLNYRKNLWQYGVKPTEIMPELAGYCTVMLANAEDVEKYFGIVPDLHQKDVSREELAQSVMTRLKSAFPRLQTVASCMRTTVNADHNNLYGMLYNGNQYFKSPEYAITDIVDRVGGGDAFMAGLIYGLLQWPDDAQRSIDFAAAASSLKHTIPGDANLATLEEVEALMAGEGAGRVSR